MSKTAKKSKKKQTTSPSKPIESLVEQWVWKDLVREIGKDNLQILDYYSQGNDAEWLRKQGYKAESFDPNNNKINSNKQYDIVLCTYVLNKIEDEAEREDMMYDIGQLLAGGGTGFLTSSRNNHIILTSSLVNSSQWFYTYML